MGQPVVAHGAIVALDVRILLRVAGLDKGQCNALLLSPGSQRSTDVFRSIVTADLDGLSSPFNDLIQSPYDALRRQRQVYFNAKTFPVVIVNHIEQPVAATIF